MAEYFTGSTAGDYLIAGGTMAAMLTALTLYHGNNSSSSSSSDSSTTYSNVIIFGDSQSDIGNMPENETLYTSSTQTNIATNVYVPISNPVDTTTDSILSFSDLDIEFPPTTNTTSFSMTLPSQLSICDGTGESGCSTRSKRSLNWAQYFLYNGTLSDYDLFPSGTDLRPWIIQYEQSATPTIYQSIDYAWDSARSDDTCVDFDGNSVTCGTAEEIYTTQNDYRTGQSVTDPAGNITKRGEVIIPNAQKQVELFAQDVAAGKVKVNDNTLYIVWTGANDLSDGFEQYLACLASSGSDCEATWLTDRSTTIPNEIVGSNSSSVVSRLLALNDSSIAVKHILVIGQYDLGLTPGVVKLGGVFNFNSWITEFNQSLETDISNNFSDNSYGATVEYADIQSGVNLAVQSANGGGYITNTENGEECVNPTGNGASTIVPALLSGSAASCTNDVDPTPIGWWNDSHLGTQFQQLIAYYIAQAA